MFMNNFIFWSVKWDVGCGKYRKFSSLEEGLRFAIDKIGKYYQKGLTTPKQIGKTYASDPNWSKKIENYMKKLKSE